MKKTSKLKVGMALLACLGSDSSQPLHNTPEKIQVITTEKPRTRGKGKKQKPWQKSKFNQ